MASKRKPQTWFKDAEMDSRGEMTGPSNTKAAFQRAASALVKLAAQSIYSSSADSIVQ